ncbi:hypothetical protein [Streptomyces sp. NPDC060010]|uniref:hypothetical protein n=1 Tax=Streptomyces sp. NPDC060010 TaxID=3347036 RepID=UPI0036A77E72
MADGDAEREALDDGEREGEIEEPDDLAEGVGEAPGRTALVVGADGLASGSVTSSPEEAGVHKVTAVPPTAITTVAASRSGAGRREARVVRSSDPRPALPEPAIGPPAPGAGTRQAG